MSFILSEYIKNFFFVFTVLLPQSVGYVDLFFAVVLSFYKKRIFRRGFREEFVGSESAGDYFNIQKHCIFS